MRFMLGFATAVVVMTILYSLLLEAKGYKLSQCEKTCEDQWEKLRKINSDTTHKHCIKIGK